MRITTGQALTSLCPTADFSASEENDGTNVQIYWHDKTQTQPTEAEIQAEIVRLQKIYDSQDYARKRKAEYDQLNQYEMMFDDKRDGTTTWVEKINEIKLRHPKNI